MKFLLKELLKYSKLEYQILGDIGKGLSDTDIVFEDREALIQFKKELIDKLKYSYSWKIELFVTRVDKHECKFHIFRDNEILGQLDLWLVVQRKGNVLYEYSRQNTIDIDGLRFVRKEAVTEYKGKKLGFSFSFRYNYIVNVINNYVRGRDWYYFYGVDGVGKSTQIELIRQYFFNDLVVVHTMPKMLRKRRENSERFASNRSDEPMNLPKSVLYPIYWSLEVLVFRLLLHKNTVVIFDRGPLETEVQEVYTTVPRYLKRWLLKCHKSISNTFVFTGDGSLIWCRKKELTLERTKFQISRYEQLQKNYGVWLVDAREGIDKVHDKVKVMFFCE